ncbi:MAG: ion channel [Myxococcota bacterium]
MQQQRATDMVRNELWYIKIMYFVVVIASILNVVMREKSIVSIFFTLVLISVLIITRLTDAREPFRLYLVLSVVAFVSDVSYMGNSEYTLKSISQLISDCLHFFFTGFVVFLIASEIFQKKKITKDAVAGGVCIYLLLADMWSLVYANLYLLDNMSFHAPDGTVSSFDCLFFSFTTFTTTGYGDIVPVTMLAKSIAMSESVTGVMLPAVFISRLVGLYDNSAAEGG